MRISIIILLPFLFVLLYPTTGQANPYVSANNAILIEQSSGRVLFEKDAHQKESIASITKIMTAIIAVESGKMKETSKTSRRAIYTEGSSIYLEQGERMTIEDLVYGLMLRSGNDAAVAIGEHIGQSEEGFVYLMNEKANWLGMTNTHFDNPHGLDAENHYSTAYDMAILMQYAMDNALFRKISGTITHQADKRSYAWQNKNKLLTSIYDNCTGGKTGFTKKTGRTLVTTASKNNMDLIAVTLDASDDWRDHIQMYEWGFENYKLKKLGPKESKLANEKTGFLRGDILYPLTTKEVSKISKKTFLSEAIEELRTDIVGKAVFYMDSNAIVEAPLYESGAVNEKTSFLSEVLLNTKRIIGWY